MKLQNWYADQCNKDWEHTYGIRITNIDNPGWSIEIDLFETDLENQVFDEINLQRDDERDWIFCRTEGNIFKGYGGPYNLIEIVDIFLGWVDGRNGN